ncbi:MAG: TonB-dependent receptor [Rikenellaceae bacterium]|nr:TonB-dependent receptor [Rikenellaceae bacterium]
MKRILPLIVCLFSGLTALAQQTSILKGIITDSENGQPLPGAVILVDSTRHAVADQKGAFSITRIARGEKQVEISFLGYEPVSRTVNLDQSTVDLGTVRMEVDKQEIEAVEVTAEIPMAVQKGDTIQYNAGAFKTSPDADAGDLINKMPGTEVGDDGSVTVQGEAVKKVYVDGKKFFGDDVAAAMRNLPADIVESVQMFEELTDEAKFAGFDDGNRDRAINIVTKHKFNRTTTGRIEAGYGVEVDKDPDGDRTDRYLIGGNINTFTEKHRWSLNGTFNNVNRANRARGFSDGGGGGMRGGGLRTINSIGLNYSGTWTEELNFNAYYSFNQNRSNNESWTERDYFKADEEDEHRFERNDSKGHSTDNAHEGGVRLEYKGEKNMVFFNAQGSYSQTDGWSNTTDSVTLDGFLNSLIRENTVTSNDSYSVNGNLMWTHRLGEKAGRTITFGANGSYSQNDAETDRQRDAELSDNVSTYTTTNSWNRSLGGRFSYA